METTVVSWGVHTQCSRSSTAQIMEEMAIFCVATHYTPCVCADGAYLSGTFGT